MVNTENLKLKEKSTKQDVRMANAWKMFKIIQYQGNAN